MIHLVLYQFCIEIRALGWNSDLQKTLVGTSRFVSELTTSDWSLGTIGRLVSELTSIEEVRRVQSSKRALDHFDQQQHMGPLDNF